VKAINDDKTGRKYVIIYNNSLAFLAKFCELNNSKNIIRDYIETFARNFSYCRFFIIDNTPREISEEGFNIPSCINENDVKDDEINKILKELYLKVKEDGIIKPQKFENNRLLQPPYSTILNKLEMTSMIISPMNIKGNYSKLLVFLNLNPYVETHVQTISMAMMLLEKSIENNISAISKYIGRDNAIEKTMSKDFKIDEFFKSGFNEHCGILFGDIRKFSKFVNNIKQDHRTLFKGWMSDYYKCVRDIVYLHNGIVTSFMGDGFLALYDVIKGERPLTKEEIVIKMIESAKKIYSQFQELKINWKKQGEQLLDLPSMSNLGMGFAMNIGTATLDRFDRDNYSSYDAIGSSINLTSRVVDFASKEITINKDDLNNCIEYESEEEYYKKIANTVEKKSKKQYNLSIILALDNAYKSLSPENKKKYLPIFNNKWRCFKILVKSFDDPIEVHEIKISD